jgi:hypothetical protein
MGELKMNVNSALNAGVKGFNQASQGVEKAALEINRATTESQTSEQQKLQAAPQETVTTQAPARVDEALVNLRVEQFNAQANTRTIQTADEVLGTLIDVRV